MNTMIITSCPATWSNLMDGQPAYNASVPPKSTLWRRFGHFVMPWQQVTACGPSFHCASIQPTSSLWRPALPLTHPLQNQPGKLGVTRVLGRKKWHLGARENMLRLGVRGSALQERMKQKHLGVMRKTPEHHLWRKLNSQHQRNPPPSRRSYPPFPEADPSSWQLMMMSSPCEKHGSWPLLSDPP